MFAQTTVAGGLPAWVTPAATLLAVLIGGAVNWLAQAKLADKRAAAEASAAKDRFLAMRLITRRAGLKIKAYGKFIGTLAFK